MPRLLISILLTLRLTTASLFLPFLDPLTTDQIPLPALSNVTDDSPDSPFDLSKRQTLSTGCPANYGSCANLGASGLCCANNAICTADNAGYVACCPIGAACTGTITGIVTGGTIPPGGTSTRPTTTTNAVLTGTTSVTTTGLFSSATTPNNGLVVAGGGATASLGATTTNGGFIISGGTTVASPAGAERGVKVPWVAEVILAACQGLRLL
ncbi:hypothetical protein BDZ85DRAFT_284015 [Elsinoe ampelina]|uniref:Uncharacterized protein n=1 Tax=Elsinoe ampelina TaxID=302913 RepID=A0A6A6G6C8_9PEZI|nr:hypothetical protein BDZ85DRAFT_284015 [Elsinoe ampelina]